MPSLSPRLALLVLFGGAVSAAEPNPAALRRAADYVPEVAALAVPAGSELRELVERFAADRAEVERFASVKGSVAHQQRMREFFATWQTRLAAVEFGRLGVDGRIDATLLRTRLAQELRLIEREAKRAAEVAPVLPFAEAIARLQEARRFLQPVDAKAAAAALDGVRQAVEQTRAALEAGLKAANAKETAVKDAGDAKTATGKGLVVSKVVAFRAAGRLAALERSLDEWFKTYDGYDPGFGWWVREPHKQVTEAFADYGKFLREKVAGIDPKGKEDPIIGDPIGREGLMADLASELIVYSPEELIAIAEREFTWVDTELKRAAGEMGLGDDWRAALEKVKQDYVEPGQQPGVVRDLALEATRFVTERGLVTVPPLAADVWLLRMMPPEQQKVAPFFLGGNDILVAYPTEAMSQAEKLASLRANNRHFARATVFHELVPGHHLQAWAGARFNPHRELFATPFWTEGWSVWWEFHLWDLKFVATPEDRMGALFWRAHRCARIIFSLKFHLGEWTPQQCIDFLVGRVGHERASATGEVRRSFNGSYPPLYQAGYMLGAMQLRGLYGQLVGGGPGQMSERTFHDEVLRGGPMPIELVRARLRQEKVPPDFRPGWRFAD